jgi:hypothetical protein
MQSPKERRFALLAWRAAVAGLAAVAVAGGCRFVSMLRSPGAFDHSRHAAKGITCDACHGDDESQPIAGMPSNRECLACHGRSELREPYAYELEIQREDPRRSFAAPERHFDLKFSHAVHRGSAAGCGVCHESEPAHRAPARAGACEDCHRREGIASDCVVCHEQTTRSTAPTSHQAAGWLRAHGRDSSRPLSAAHGEGCRLCHSQSSCDGCHRVLKPSDHTEFFRLRGHGLSASIQRERCAACHQEDSCVRCHQETRPRSHFRATWAGRTSSHCLSCHEPLGDASCFVCHRAAPSHARATPIPPPPHPSALSDCRRCHLRPPHADNGGSCTVCHR